MKHLKRFNEGLLDSSVFTSARLSKKLPTSAYKVIGEYQNELEAIFNIGLDEGIQVKPVAYYSGLQLSLVNNNITDFFDIINNIHNRIIQLDIFDNDKTIGDGMEGAIIQPNDEVVINYFI